MKVVVGGCPPLTQRREATGRSRLVLPRIAEVRCALPGGNLRIFEAGVECREPAPEQEDEGGLPTEERSAVEG